MSYKDSLGNLFRETQIFLLLVAFSGVTEIAAQVLWQRRREQSVKRSASHSGISSRLCDAWAKDVYAEPSYEQVGQQAKGDGRSTDHRQISDQD